MNHFLFHTILPTPTLSQTSFSFPAIPHHLNRINEETDCILDSMVSLSKPPGLSNSWGRLPHERDFRGSVRVGLAAHSTEGLVTDMAALNQKELEDPVSISMVIKEILNS